MPIPWSVGRTFQIFAESANACERFTFFVFFLCLAVGSAVAAASATHKDAVINAAYDGIMVDKLVEIGDLAAPGLFTMEKTQEEIPIR